MSGLSTILSVLVLALAIGLVPGLAHLKSYLSGWHALARRFRTTSTFPDDAITIGPRSLTLYMARWSKYPDMVRLAVSREGIFLSISYTFRIAHPRLFLPWHETHIAHDRRWFQDFTVITLGNSERIPLRIPAHAAESLGLTSAKPTNPA